VLIAKISSCHVTIMGSYPRSSAAFQKRKRSFAGLKSHNSVIKKSVLLKELNHTNDVSYISIHIALNMFGLMIYVFAHTYVWKIAGQIEI